MSVRGLLLFEVLADDADGRSARRRKRSSWTPSSSPSISTSVACASAQTSAKMPRRTSMARASNTRRRYFVTKTKWTCNLKTQCLPCRISLSWLIDQLYHGVMRRLQAFKFELRPTGRQRQQMRCFAGSCRFAYNNGLALQKARFAAGEKHLSYAGLCKLLTQWRHNTETSWLQDAPTHPLQQALKDLERAYTNFFARTGRLAAFQEEGDSTIASVIPTRSRSSSSRRTRGCSCPSSAGCAIATAARCWAR